MLRQSAVVNAVNAASVEEDDAAASKDSRLVMQEF